MSKTSFKIVFIPAVVEEAIAEWDIELPSNKDKQISCLTERLRKHFKTANSQACDNELFRKQIQEQLPKGTTVTDEMMNMVMKMDSLVDCIPLVNNSPEAKFVGVNMYVDDRGTAKNLSVNIRASAIAQQCRRMVEVRGDAFIGRVFDNDDDFERIDFHLEELNGNAEWMLQARILNKNSEQQKPGQTAETNSLLKNVMKSTARIENVCNSELCSKSGKLRCSRCKSTFYCSPACQKVDWKNHKNNCLKK